MAGVSETRTYDALLTTTLANYRKKLVDNIFDTYPLLSWLNGKLGTALRGEAVKRTVNGGESIVEHLLYEQNSTAKSYSGSELLDTTLQDGMTIARYNWKQYSATVGITGLEERANGGEAALIRLLESKTKQEAPAFFETDIEVVIQFNLNIMLFRLHVFLQFWNEGSLVFQHDQLRPLIL